MDLLLSILAGLGFLAALAYVGWRWLRSSDDPARLVFRWILTAVLVGGSLAFAAGANEPLTKVFAIGVASISALVLAAYWVPGLAGAFAKPFTSLYDGGDQEVEPTPFYSIAEARRKLGRYADAVAEVRRQLDRFPDDFQGLLMLAEIQAAHMADLAGAQASIERILLVPGQPPRNLALALNRLADLHLRHGQDPDSARLALERIASLLPGTEQAYLAGQRIAHLGDPSLAAPPADRRPETLGLPHHEERVGLAQPRGDDGAPARTAEETAAALVRLLEERPGDNEAREQLAMLYAGHYQRPELAIEQIEQLAAQSGLPPRTLAHWMNLLADIHVRHLGNEAGAVDALQRLAAALPGTAAAETARNRLARIGLEIRGQKKSQAVRLGSYEQNIGLRDGPPPPPTA